MAIFIQKPWYRKQESGHIYGVSWDGTSRTDWTRTDDAASFGEPNPYYAGMSGTPSSPFDNLLPWSGMVVEEDANAGTVVKIPKFWYKWTRNGASMKLQIADYAADGFYCSPAHADRGDGSGERDFVYVGRYHCGESNYKSATGVLPKVRITRDTARTAIANLGSKVWQFDFAMRWTINMLYLVEFADWNSQAKIGYCCGNNSGVENAGASDGMPYHTGTMQTSRTTYGVGVQYRHIEDWWGNARDWCDGIYFSGAYVYCIKNPSAFADSTGGTKVGTRSTGSGGYIKAWNTPSADGFEYALYPSDHSASEGTYVCDYCEYGSSGVVLFVGGSYSYTQISGAFCLLGDFRASGSSGSIGCRLMILP